MVFIKSATQIEALNSDARLKMSPFFFFHRRHSVIEAVYNRLNPQREDDGVSECFLLY